MLRSPAALALLALPLLAGCNASQTPVASAPPAYASQRFPVVDMPVGTGCAAVIGRFEAVIKADYETGNVNAKVYEQMQKELGPARTSCVAGDDSGSRGVVAGVRSRHGYPAG